MQAGRAWPAARFAVQGECVTDRLTGLVWPRNADLPGGLRNWQQALDFAGGLSLCGFDDWRLPNRKELWSLVNFGASGTPGSVAPGPGLRECTLPAGGQRLLRLLELDKLRL